MSLGTGLFLSALVVSLVLLYAVTKDRWNWKRIALWGTLVPIALIAVASAVGYLLWVWNDMPRPLESFYGIALRASEQDVRFMKGEPTSKAADGTWVYDIQDSVSGKKAASYSARFKDGKVRFVFYVPGDYHSGKEYPFGFSDGTSLERVEAKLGKPTFVSESDDGSTRLYSYADYNAFFGFSKGVVEVYGMYDPATGPMKLAKEK